MAQQTDSDSTTEKGYDDPLWKQRRREIIGRDSSTCQNCGETFPRQLLNVHHRCYREYSDGTRLPLWDYPDSDLITLCRDCHEEGHQLYGQAPVYVVQQ